MKTIFRFLGLAVLIAGGMSVYAQDPTPTPDPCDATVAARTPIEDKIRTNYNTQDIPLRKDVNNSGDEYLKTYANDPCQAVKDFATYLNGYLPGSKKWVADQELIKKRKELLGRFNPAIGVGPAGAPKNINWDEAYVSGKELIALEPESANALNTILVLGSIGLDETLKTPRVTKYNDDTLKYAKLAIEKLNAGKTSSYFGAGQFYYGIKDKPDDKEVNPVKSKENALGWMNYTIGAITYYGLNNKKDALPFLYKATQANSQTRTNPAIYSILGDYYFDEVARLGTEYGTKATAANGVETQEMKDLVALQKGYNERAIDAYARAQEAIPVNDAARKTYREGIGKRIETLYKLRFDKTDGMAAFVKAQLANPLANPAVPPTPIVEADPVPAPTTGTAPATAPGTKPAAPGAKPAVTPANTNGTKPAATPATPVKKPVSTNGTNSGTTTAAVKPAVKKPVVKKKGTR